MSRMSPRTINDDVQTLDAVSALGDYAPVNADFSTATLNDLKKAMETKRAIETVKVGEAAAARDAAVAAERAFHDGITGARLAVKSQYGKDSNQVQAVGMKKSSEIVRGRRKSALPNNP